ncbi:hypothetical protein B0H19DRAFT_1073927 [Mycena capillaripes]|nr:hypothetical protein B0H19DRAFT_1073927 [Mycena capillaripes]
MSPIPTVKDFAAISGQLLPSPILCTTAVITLVFAVLTYIMQIVSPTPWTAVVAHRLSVAQQSFNYAVAGDRVRLVEPATAEDLTRRLRTLEDTAERLCTETLGYAGSSGAPWPYGAVGKTLLDSTNQLRYLLVVGGEAGRKESIQCGDVESIIRALERVYDLSGEKKQWGLQQEGGSGGENPN